jgi:DNA processing protein
VGQYLSEKCRDIVALTAARWPKGVREDMSSVRPADLDQAIASDRSREELAFIDKEGIKAYSVRDEGYPLRLREIHDPPPVIFVKGDLLECDTDSVAIVGARMCSMYGARMAEKLAFELALRGITVVSGMARGIDSAAHVGALKAGGRTIAVMGSGFKNIYPSESADLAGKISLNGAVITEFPSLAEPLKHNFPRRNRIVSGLVKGVVVVEAALKSGAMITVDFALDQGKDVFAVPGRADSGMSEGTNHLIRTGANILEELKIGSAPKEAVKKAVLSDDEKALMRVLRKEHESHLDALAESSGLGLRTNEVLLRMELKGLVKAHPGRVYALAAPR